MRPEDIVNRLRGRAEAYLPYGSLRRRLVRGTFWSILGTGISQGLALAVTIIMGRVLGKQGFGELGMIRSTVGMFGVFAGLGLGLTSNKHVAEYRSAKPERAGRIIGLTTVVAVCSSGLLGLMLLVGSPSLAPKILAAETLQQPALMVLLLQVGCVMLFFDGLNGAQTGALSGFEAFKTVARVNLLQGLISFPLMVFGVLGWGLRGAVVALAVTSLAGYVLNHRALRREARKAGVSISYHGLGEEFPVLWRFTLPAVLSGIMVGPVLWAANAMLVNTKEGYASLGVFNAANQWQVPVIFLASQMGAVLLPMLSSLQKEEGGEGKSERVLGGTFAAMALVMFPLEAVIGSLAVPVIGLYGPQFAGAIPVLFAVLFIAGTRSLGLITGTAITSRGAMWSGLAINGLWGVTLLALVWAWADRGAIGFAEATALSYAVTTVVGMMFLGWRRFVSWGLVVRIVTATLLLGVILYAQSLAETWWLRAAVVTVASGIGVGFFQLSRPRMTGGREEARG